MSIFKRTAKSCIGLYAAAASMLLAVSSAEANCPEDLPVPVISLVPDLMLRSPVGGVLGEMGYLQFGTTTPGQNWPSGETRFEGQVQVQLQDGTVGLAPRDLVLVMDDETSSSCTMTRVTMSAVPQTLEDRSSPLQAKALIGATVARQSTEGGDEAGVSFRIAPSFSADVLDQALQYRVVYIYSRHQSDEVIDGVRRQETWYYVGLESDLQFRTDRSDETRLHRDTIASLRGWVHESDLTFWSQRQATFPAGSESIDTIFLEPSLQTPVSRIEYLDEMSPNRAQAILRLPLLEAYDYEGRQIFRVAYPQVRDNSEDLGTVVVETDVENLLRLLGDRSQAIDVLVVLDNTESMEIYRDAVINGLNEVNGQVESFENLRVAFAMFGDAFGNEQQATAWAQQPPRYGFDPNWRATMGNQPFQFWMSEFSRSGRFPTVQELQTLFGGAYDDPQSDLVEMGLPALSVAARNANWRDESLRVVIYIGDDFSRSSGTGFFSTSGLAETLMSEQTLFIPINVSGREADRENQLWIDQANAVSGSMQALPGAGGGVDTVIIRGNDGRNDVLQAQESIRAFVAGIFALSDVYSCTPDGVYSGTHLCNIGSEAIQARAEELRVPLVEVLDPLLMAYANTSLEEMELLLSRNDIVLEGFYPADEAEEFVALNFQEQHAITSAVSDACVSMANTATMRTDLEDMAQNLAQSFLGERRSIGANEPISEFFKRLTFLPSEYFGVFGDRTLEEFTDWVDGEATEAERSAVHRELCLSARLLETIGNGEQARRDSFQEPVFNERIGVFMVEPRQPLRDFDWLWGFEGTVSLVFVPREFFPQAVD